ncbi:siderophore-interacting protein [Massilia sp. YIM B02443]|uniref:siderophore-interacting protein n=1 Tax=Massilia sp. YIM B02443 TaxID=3050127 RepID=UPI0025B70D6D|nr:siderophore-interacting protein [Massilia sp. YIM B02443]MDN4039334.1 siderophore-interacting protein [Massilia sp. YIM B02443]
MSEFSTPANVPVIERVRHDLKMRDVEVVRIDQLSPGFAAITFKGEALSDFISLSFDDHVKFMFDGADGQQVRRDYTPRRFDREARELTLEFALHGHGGAAEWARNASVGQRAIIGGPRGSMILPLEMDWHLLIGDDSALPAITRRLEELPQGARAQVVILADAADRRGFFTNADADIHWVGSGDALIAVLSGLPLQLGAGIAWGGGEAALMVRVRQLLLDKGLPRQATRVSAYWKHGVPDHHEHLD